VGARAPFALKGVGNVAEGINTAYNPIGAGAELPRAIGPEHPREVEVRAAVNNLFARVEMLQMSANTLIDRLAPVLSPAALAAADTGGDPKAPQCALADELDSFSLRIAATTDALQDTLRRLEV
jgi:hypothetical protein